MLLRRFVQTKIWEKLLLQNFGKNILGINIIFHLKLKGLRTLSQKPEGLDICLKF